MSKKLMLLAVGALTALAFTALPSMASAGEWEHHCTNSVNNAPEECHFTITGNAASLINDNGETVSCTTVTGVGTAVATGTTGTVELTFHGCKETISGFNFSCNSPGQPSGTITTNTMTSHNIYIDPTHSTPGLLLTGANVTFTCAAFITKTVTGNIIGHLTNPNCTSAVTSMGISFTQSSSGQQTYKQVTTTGTVFDLISGTESSDTTTSSQTGTGTITTETGQHIRLTCNV